MALFRSRTKKVQAGKKLIRQREKMKLFNDSPQSDAPSNRLQVLAASRWKWLIITAPFAAFLVAAKMLNSSPPTNRAQTSPDGAPELRTRVYPRDLNTTFDAVREVVQNQTTYGRSWRIVESAHAESDLTTRHLNVEVPVLFFTDDLKVTLRAQGEKTSVDVESKSRVGQGDFGENRRHIMQFLRDLDEKFTK